MEKKVAVYVMRHGPKDGDKLTEEGERSVQLSAVNNLAGLEFHALYASRKYRALQTVVIAVGTLEGANRGMSIEARDGFDFAGAPGLKDWPKFDSELKRRVAAGEAATVALWQDIAPEYVNHQRPRITAEILAVAKDMAAKYKDLDEINVLVGCHGPCSELACLDPKDMPAINEADIVKYEIQLLHLGCCGWKAQIVASTYLPRGF